MERERRRPLPGTNRGKAHIPSRLAGEGQAADPPTPDARRHTDLDEGVPPSLSATPSAAPAFVATAPLRTPPVTLDRHASTEDAFFSIATACVAQIQANVTRVAMLDGEGVHQMRVGLRRLRSALAVFSPVITCPTLLTQDLKWLAGVLGTARDWDVLANGTLSATIALLGDTPQAQQARELRDAGIRRAHLHQREAAGATGAARFAALLDSLIHWLRIRGWRRHHDTAQRDALAAPARAFAQDALRQRQRKLIRRGNGLARGGAEQRHRARIAAKKLRYTIEFFASLLPGKRRRQLKSRLSVLLDELGRRNDLAVGSTLLHALSAEYPETAAAVAFLRGYLSVRASTRTRKLLRSWKRLRSMLAN